MAVPPTTGTGSTGEHTPGGSSIVNLLPANPDDRPTVIGGLRPNTTLPSFAPGQTLGHFELLETIGRGGMATVLKARDLELGRIVALKILPPETINDAESVSRFKQEARAAALLDHDHIARVYFCGEDRGLHFIAFEFVAGENLRVVMERDGKLAPATAVRYMLHVASGLKHAAERGVVHRDIKPSNILITPEGQAKIVDMGLARHLEAGGVSGGVTQSGVTLGTFDYISPEQALDPRRADVRSDIYSLGCTFYHALTGRPAVPEGTAAKKLQSHQQDAPIDPRDLNPAVPEALAAVLARMMAKNPDRRYQTADDLIRDLQAAAPSCGYVLETPLLDETAPRAVPALPAPGVKLPLAWLLVGSAAAVALAIMLGRTPNTVPAAPPWGDPYATSKSPQIETTTGSASNTNDAARAILTVQQIVDVLKTSEAVTLRLKSGTTYDLTQAGEGISYSGAGLTIEADGPGAPPILRVAAAAIDGDSSRPGSLTVRNCKSFSIRGVTVALAAPINATDPDPAAGILLTNVTRAMVSGCRIHREATSDSTAAGLAVVNESAGDFTIRNSIVDAGPQAIGCLIRGPVKVDADECAFAPHEAAFSTSEANELKLLHCTFLLDRGAAVRTDSPLAVTAGCCLFASAEKAPDEPTMPGTDTKTSRAVVLRIDSDATAKFTGITDQPNGYFHVTPVVQNEKTFTLADVPAVLFKDPAARMLARLPWASTDPRPLVNGSDPAGAFKLSLSETRLRLPPASGAVILGAKSLGASDTRIYPGAWPPERPQPVKAASGERIVWPDAEPDDLAYRLYPNFAAAFAALQPGETLSLAVNGPVPVPLLPERSLRATIRAAEGFKPVLVADGPSFTTDSMLLRLAEGDVTFENLEIRLKDRQAIVSVAGRTSCTFRRCVLTLVEKADAPGTAVVIPDAAREMRIAGMLDEPPRVTFVESILRGVGRGVWVQSARAFELSFDNCAVAIDGSLVMLDTSEKTGEAPRGKVRLKNSTIVVDDSLLEVKCGRTGGAPAFAAIETEGCIFASPDGRSTTSTLVLLDDAEPMTDLAKHVTWSGRGSVYSFAESSSAVDWKPGTETWDWPQWLRFARDDGKHTPRLRFARGSLRSKLATAEAADFAPAAGAMLDAGANVHKLPGN